MQKAGIWSRVGLWFRNNRQHPERSISGFHESAGALAVAEPETSARDSFQDLPTAAPEAETEGEARAAARPEHKTTSPPTLLESLEHHVLLQSERSEQVAAAIGELSRIVSHLPESSKSLVASVHDVSRHLEEGTQRLQRLEQPVFQIPHLADSQREAMVSIGHQLDRLRQAVDNESRLLGELHETVRGLGASNDTVLNDLKRIQLDSSTSHERVVSCLQIQTQRLTWFAAGAFVLALIGFVFGLIVLMH